MNNSNSSHWERAAVVTGSSSHWEQQSLTASGAKLTNHVSTSNNVMSNSSSSHWEPHHRWHKQPEYRCLKGWQSSDRDVSYAWHSDNHEIEMQRNGAIKLPATMSTAWNSVNSTSNSSSMTHNINSTMMMMIIMMMMIMKW